MPNLAQSADVRAPYADEPEVISVTTSSAATKLIGSSGKISNANSGRIFTWYADGGAVYAVFGPSTATADDTASTGATVPLVFPSGVPIDMALPDVSGLSGGGSGDLYIACKTATGTAKLRFWPSSGK